MKVEYFKKLKEYEDMIKKNDELKKRIEISDNRSESFSEQRNILTKDKKESI